MERNWRILLVLFLTLICRQFVDAFYTNQRRFGSEERTRRHIINKNEVPVNVEWLTDEQLSELGTLDSTHQVVEKIRSFYQSLVSSEEKKAAANKIVHQCYDWLPEVTNEAERDELKRLHHTDHAACKDRIGVYISRLSTARQDQLRHYWDFCEHVWHDTVQHQDVVAMEAAAAAEQAEENDGEITAGDGNQSEVISSRRRRSYDSNREVLDDEEDDDDGDEGSVEQDVDQLAQNYYNIEWTTSSHRKQPKRKHKNYNSVELMDIIYGNSNGDEPHIRQHRNRRHNHDHHDHDADHMEHTLEECFNAHLSWLNDAQKKALTELKGAGVERAAILDKVFEFYEETADTKKENATALLRSGCRDMLRNALGDQGVAEVRKMKESGRTPLEIAAKIREMVGALSDEKKKTAANDYVPYCAKLYGVKLNSGGGKLARRRRRHDGHQHQTLDDYFKTHLSWLNDVQKEELRTLKASGQSRADLQKKVYDFYETTTGEVKEKATELLKSGCQELLHGLIGEDKANEVKKLKEAGKTVDEIAVKVKEMVAAVTDSAKMELAKEYGPYCQKLYGVKSGGRKRRDHHHENHLDHHGQHSLEDYYKTHLSWLTDVQKEELKSLKASGQSRADLQKQIYKYYDTTTGDTKDKATELLKSGCQELLKAVIGEDKTNEIKKLKDTGKTVNEISTKVREWVEAIPDEHKKGIAKDYLPQCAKLYGVKSRKRRDHQLEDYFSSHLSWLTDAQKEDLKSFKASGQSRSALHAKIRDYFEATTGETKEKATTQMKAGCQELLTQLIGEEKMAEVKRLKEAGTPLSDIAVKVNEFISALTDDAAKARVKEYGPHCQKLFNLSDEKMTKRRRRHHENGAHHHHHHEHTLEDYMATHLEWLTDEQKAEIRARKAAGESRLALQHAVFEFYYALPSDGEIKMGAMTQLKTVCRESLARVAQKVSNSNNQLKFDGDDAAIPAQIDTLTFALSHLSETESGRSSAMEADSVREVGPHCRRLFIGNDAVAHVSHRLRRNHHSLLTRRMGRKEVAEEMLTKTADQEENAKRLLREMTASLNAPVDADIMLAGCEQLTKRFFGRQNAHRLTLLYRSGELEILKRNVAALIERISDAKRQAETRRYMNVCWTVVSTLNGGLEEN